MRVLFQSSLASTICESVAHLVLSKKKNFNNYQIKKYIPREIKKNLDPQFTHFMHRLIVVITLTVPSQVYSYLYTGYIIVYKCKI